MNFYLFLNLPKRQFPNISYRADEFHLLWQKYFQTSQQKTVGLKAQSKFTFERRHLCFHRRNQRASWAGRGLLPESVFPFGLGSSRERSLGSAWGSPHGRNSHSPPWTRPPRLPPPPTAPAEGCCCPAVVSCSPRGRAHTPARLLLSKICAVFSSLPASGAGF